MQSDKGVLIQLCVLKHTAVRNAEHEPVSTDEERFHMESVQDAHFLIYPDVELLHLLFLKQIE